MGTVNQKRRRCRSRSRSQWTDLPRELLEKILMNSSSDVLRARLVCKSWYSSLPNPNFYPSSRLSLPFPFKEESLQFDALETIVLALSPLGGGGGGGILKLQQKRCGKLRAMNPLQFDERVFKRVTEVVNLTDYHVKVLHRCYMVDNHDYSCQSIRKVVVIGNTIGAILYDRDLTSDLNFFKLGDTKWTKLQEGKFQDMTVFKDRFYAVDHDGLLAVIDPSSLQVSHTHLSLGRNSLDEHLASKSLVESSGNLFLVTVLWFKASSSRVYKLDEGEGLWRHVTNLDDRIFIMGDPECLFSTSAYDFPPEVCKKWNCVYLHGRPSSDEFPDKKVVHRGLSTQFKSLYSFMDCSYQPSLADCPDAMNIFWNLKPCIDR